MCLVGMKEASVTETFGLDKPDLKNATSVY